VLLRESTNDAVFLRVAVNMELIIEGKVEEKMGYVEMISEGSIHYCVIKKMITSDEISFDYNKR
jgi:hypothetical protein